MIETTTKMEKKKMNGQVQRIEKRKKKPTNG